MALVPIRDLLGKVAAVTNFDDMTRLIAAQESIGGPVLFAAFAPGPDPTDSSRYGMYSTGQSYGVQKNFTDLLRNQPNDPRVPAYWAYVADVLHVAGNSRPDQFYMFEPRALSSLAELWRSTPIEDLKDYMAFRTIAAYSPYLTSAFKSVETAFAHVLQGTVKQRPRADYLYGILTETLGHPASQVYVKSYFPEETRADVLDMVDRLRGVFRKRIETRDWLSDATRAEALAKVDAFYYKVGFPDVWVDYSSVEIGPDLIANVKALAAFNSDRIRQLLPLPVVHEEFNTSSTLPIVINAAYSSSINGFEVTAAIVQPPAYSSDMDAPLRFCRAGAIIGHEMTHGFDSGGRQFDAKGNFRDWWTPSDATAFEIEAQKLIDQANKFEVLPGLHANGPLNVRENMADVGGITFAHQALMEYLAEHPEENVTIDGLTPEQRCFIGWAQLWTMKAAEPYLRAIVANDGHPPNFYRAVATLQHVDAFYSAFNINEGDPMWLPPNHRVRAW